MAKSAWKNLLHESKQSDHAIDNKTISNVIKRIKNGKAPGKDCIIGYWYKSLSFCKQNLTNLMNEVLIEDQQLPTKTPLLKPNLSLRMILKMWQRTIDQ